MTWDVRAEVRILDDTWYDLLADLVFEAWEEARRDGWPQLGRKRPEVSAVTGQLTVRFVDVPENNLRMSVHSVRCLLREVDIDCIGIVLIDAHA